MTCEDAPFGRLHLRLHLHPMYDDTLHDQSNKERRSKQTVVEPEPRFCDRSSRAQRSSGLGEAFCSG